MGKTRQLIGYRQDTQFQTQPKDGGGGISGDGERAVCVCVCVCVCERERERERESTLRSLFKKPFGRLRSHPPPTFPCPLNPP